jgi:hypothetical protein
VKHNSVSDQGLCARTMIAVQRTVGTSPAHGWWIRDCLRAASAPTRSPVREEKVQLKCRVDASSRFSFVKPRVLRLLKLLHADSTVQCSFLFGTKVQDLILHDSESC